MFTNSKRLILESLFKYMQRSCNVYYIHKPVLDNN